MPKENNMPITNHKFTGPTSKFNHHKFDDLKDDEVYLVFFKKDMNQQAMVAPSLQWLYCALTYVEDGDVTCIKKVKIVDTYKPA